MTLSSQLPVDSGVSIGSGWFYLERTPATPVDFVVMPLSYLEVKARRDEYRTFGWKVDERPPVTHDDVPVGTTLSHWGLPNKNPFIFLGVNESGKVLACLEDGYVVRFGADSWFAVIGEGQRRHALCIEARERVEAAYRYNQQLWAA